ncbi:MAG: ATP-dependent zinc metalloprotease FtsH [Patescibacteria group bacterium]|nr:ATP-dependent zinc metalloprotease FtsH [Patescibacteria group bacterium]
MNNMANKAPNKKKQKKSKGSFGPIITLLIISFTIGGSYTLMADQEIKDQFSLDTTIKATETVSTDISLSQVIIDSDNDLIDTIEVIENKDLLITYKSLSGTTLSGAIVDNTSTPVVLKSSKEIYSSLIELGVDPNKVDIIVSEESGKFWKELAGSILPFLIIIALFVFLMRKSMGGGAAGMMGGKDFDKQVNKKPDTKFKDVAGIDEAKEELMEVVDFLKHGKKYQKMGAKIPRGVLLFGAPGTGKTLVAKAVAGEAEVPFFHIAGSEFEEMFVGVGASRVRDLFTKAKQSSPAIIFIDEIDAVGKKRQTGGSTATGSSTSEQTLNQILVEMDGFDTDTNVIVIAATNRPEILDPALLRPGRFDRRISIDPPNIKEREEILQVHTKDKPMHPEVNYAEIAKATSGFSGADLANMLNEAAILSTKYKKKSIDMEMIHMAIEKVVIGLEKKSRKLSEKERKITAYHEAGHAICGHLNPLCEPVHKISIVSRGSALGVTWYLPQEDTHLTSKEKFEQDLVSYLGGRAAEQVMFGSITTGASNDIERATQVARNMIMVYGMGSMANVAFGNPAEINNLSRSYSDSTAQKIDDEVQQIITTAYQNAINLLTENKDKLKEIGDILLEKETIDATEFQKLMSDREVQGPKQA